MDDKLIRHIDDARYGGPQGAIAQSNKMYTIKLKTTDSDNKKVLIMMEHINVLYSAMTANALGGVTNKMYALYLAVRVTSLAKKVESFKSSLNLQAIIGAGGCHVLMSVWARDMQILRRIKVFEVMPGLKKKLYDRMMESYNMIAVIASAESRVYESKDSADVSPANRMHLLGATLLYELSLEGLYTYPKPGQAQELCHHVNWFCTARRTVGFAGRDEVQLVGRLWRGIGNHEMSAEISRKFGTIDQQNKATV